MGRPEQTQNKQEGNRVAKMARRIVGGEITWPLAVVLTHLLHGVAMNSELMVLGRTAVGKGRSSGRKPESHTIGRRHNVVSESCICCQKTWVCLIFIGSCLQNLEYSTTWVMVSHLSRMDPHMIFMRMRWSMHLSYQVSFIWKFLILNYKTEIITNTCSNDY